MTDGTIEIHWKGDFTADSIDRVFGVLNLYFNPEDVTFDTHMVGTKCDTTIHDEIVHSLSEIQWPEQGGVPQVKWIPCGHDASPKGATGSVNPKGALRHVFDRVDMELYEVRETLRLQDFRFNKDRALAGERINTAWGPDSARATAMHDVMNLYARKVHDSCRTAMETIDALRYELDVMRSLINSNDWRGEE